MSKTMQDISQYFDEPTPVAIRTRSKTHTFLFHELSKEIADDIYRPLREAKDDAAATTAAHNQVMQVAIGKMVSSEAGEFFTPEQIQKLPVLLVNKIGAKVLAFMGGEDVDTAGEEKPKPDPAADASEAEDTAAPKG